MTWDIIIQLSGLLVAVIAGIVIPIYIYKNPRKPRKNTSEFVNEPGKVLRNDEDHAHSVDPLWRPLYKEDEFALCKKPTGTDLNGH